MMMLATGPSSRRYVFMASSAYSGSTLLSSLLAAHPEIASVSDISGKRRSGRMDEYRCSCGRLMTHCPFWADVQELARARGLQDLDLADFRLGFDESPLPLLGRIQGRSLRWSAIERIRDEVLRPFGVQRRLADVGRRTWTFAQAVMDREHASVFVDASKERLRIRYLQRHLPTDLYVIHLVRDVRGVVASTLRRHKDQLTAAEVARQWSRTNATILRQLQEVPAERQIRIRYEDLCRDLETTMQRAAAFCGVDPQRPRAPLGDGVHLLGNSMRLAPPSEVRLDEGWRAQLPADLQKQILVASSPTFAMFYPHAS